MKNGLILLLFALLVLSLLGQDRSPRALIEPTPAKFSFNNGANLAAGTWQTCEPSRAPAFLVHSHEKGVA